MRTAGLLLYSVVGVIAAPALGLVGEASAAGPQGASAPQKGLAGARAAIRSGRYEDAIREAASASAKDRDAAESLAARAEVALGRYAEAEKRLAKLLARSPSDFEGRVALGKLYEATGRRDEAKAIWNGFFDDYEQGKIDKKSARALTAVGIAARGLGSHQDACDLFRDALLADEKYAPAHVEWGETFLGKYAAGEAERDALAAVKLDPDDADAHALLGRVHAEQGDVPAATRDLEKALKINPRHAVALAAQARLALEVDDDPTVRESCKKILATNPKDESAHTLLAALAFLRDDRAGYERERQAVLAVNPKSAAFHHRVAEVLVEHHRYVEANQLEEEALKLDPDDALALAGIGQNRLRLGDEQRGHEALSRAFARDAYNVRTYNLLNLFDEIIPKGYRIVEVGPFRLRAAKDEADAIAKVTRAMLTEEWAELGKRYGATPVAPVTVELYANEEHYGVRTVGLPQLEALGVTFGRVVTGRSPAEGKFNWGMMLWHEIAHTFAVHLSKARVPRWFTEGLAEWETQNRDPSWRRHTHAELYAALSQGKFLPVVSLNTGFVRARSVEEVVVAYHEAAEAVAFLIRRWGFPKAVEALRRYGAGEQTPEVIRGVTGIAPEAFDKAFQDDLRARLKVYEGQLILKSTDWQDIDALEEAAKGKPSDARAQALYALALLAARRAPADIEAQVNKALALAPKGHEALYAAAAAAQAKKDLATAERRLRELIAAGGDGYDVRMKLASVLVGQPPRRAEAEAELVRAAALDPEQAEPWEALSIVYRAKGQKADEARALEAASRLDVHDAEVPRRLAQHYAALKEWAKAREWAQRVAWIAPYDVDVRVLAGRAALEAGDAKAALRELEIAMLCNPENPSLVRGVMARALAKAGEVGKARAMAKEVLREEPANADAKMVQ